MLGRTAPPSHLSRYISNTYCWVGHARSFNYEVQFNLQRLVFVADGFERTFRNFQFSLKLELVRLRM